MRIINIIIVGEIKDKQSRLTNHNKSATLKKVLLVNLKRGGMYMSETIIVCEICLEVQNGDRKGEKINREDIWQYNRRICHGCEESVPIPKRFKIK